MAILGARQCGKTTLAHEMPYDHFFDLENPRDLARLEQPQLALEDLKGLIVIDEIQRKQDLFPLLRYLGDHHRKQKYLVLGSASRDRIAESSESLAGRISYYYLDGFMLEEVGRTSMHRLWLQGGFPRSFLARSLEASQLWRESYISTFLERDLPQLGISIPSHTLRRFWIMLSHYHGQVLNFSELGRAFGISDMTVRKYVDILKGTFMVRLLQPWYTNVGKRLIKSPKLYIRDSGLFHTLQEIETRAQLHSHPKLGASWEGFALEQILCQFQVSEGEAYFWGTHSGAQMDLFVQKKGKSWGFEFKFADAPKMTKSMRVAIDDLKLEALWVVYPGKESYRLDSKVTVIGLKDIGEIHL